MDRSISATGGRRHRRLRRLGMLALAGAWTAMAASSPVSAAQTIFDTGRVLEYTRSECVGQPQGSCVTLSSKRLRIVARSSRQITLTCDARYPYAIGWDSEQHEHLRLELVSPLPTKPGSAPAATGPQTISVVALNQADTSGFAKLFIGCSRRPWQGTPFMTFREAVPGNQAGFARSPS